MSRKTFLIAAAGVLVVGGAVVAVSAPGDRGGHRFGGHHGSMMMGGGEGHDMRGRFGRALTKDEFDTRMRERFASLDRNSDGVIDPAEIEASVNERMASRFSRFRGGEGKGGPMMGDRMLRRMGADADGKLSREKFRAEITRRFAEADLNSDGRLDDADLPPMMRGRNALDQIGQGSMQKGGMQHGGMRRGGRDGGGLQWLGRLGVTAKDGVITREAVLAAADKQFDRIDRNKDGTVDKADMDLARKEMVDYRVKRIAHRLGAGPDGRVTREQFQTKAAERFARMDFDGDGAVSRGERSGRGWGRGGRGGHGGEHHPGDMMGGPGGQGMHHGNPPSAPGAGAPPAEPPKN